MIRLTTIVVTATLLLGQSGSIVRAEISAEQVRQSINKAVAYLKSQQRADGTWADMHIGIPQSGGVTALCTLALLSAGVEPDDPVIQRALTRLRMLKPQKTYVTALQTMVFCKAEPKKNLLLIQDRVRWLERAQNQTGPPGSRGTWQYSSPAGGESGDPSNTQFALLALHEAERVGIPVDERTWRLANVYWKDSQTRDGAWRYQSRQPVSGSMTCAGIASLVITSDKVRDSNAEVKDGRILCCQQGTDDDDRVERGLQWLGRNFSVGRNPGLGPQWMFYYLYGVERVGRLTARRFIGGHDWYREGATQLLKMQKLSGCIQGPRIPETNELIGTSLALLFLSKGRRPVLMAKLEHPPGDDWNRHQSDVDNLTRFVESRWESDLTWQVMDLHAAQVEDLRQAPVLYLCGNANLLPPTADARRRLARKLRDYVDRGGFLFAEGYCGGAEFDRAFRELMQLAFPEPQYALRLLEPEHPIWRAELRVDPRHVRPLWGIEFGCRTSVVYAPAEPPRPSLSCLWELSRRGRGTTYEPKIQAQIDAALAIGVNVLTYATNRELKGKEESFRTLAGRRLPDKLDRGRVAVAKLRHPGGCNAAPRALANLLEVAGNELNLRAETREELIGLTDEALFDHHLVFMHGRNRFRFTDSEREWLRTYIERGGVLLADSICASEAFTESFRREMAAAFADRLLEPIPVDDPIWTTSYGGYDLRTVTRRDPQRRDANGPLKATLRKVPPELEGIKIDDRWAVIFSRYDLSCALERHNSLECRGYVREDAARIGLNVVLYSLQP